MNGLRLVTPPSAEPVTLAEFKTHAKIDDASEDNMCSALLIAARQWCEQYTRRAFINQTWAVSVSDVPTERAIALPRGPVSSIARVQMFDDADAATLWAASHYYLDGECLMLRSGATWPSFVRSSGAMRIEYVAGFGASASAVPEAIRLAIKQLALHWYEHRGEAIASAAFIKAPLTIEALLQPFRVLSLGGV